jgi:hypothetical protein
MFDLIKKMITKQLKEEEYQKEITEMDFEEIKTVKDKGDYILYGEEGEEIAKIPSDTIKKYGGKIQVNFTKRV